MNKRARGTLGEDLAVVYLRKKGYRVLERNFRFRRGEIDIVAEENGVLVFVEVKARWSKKFGEAEDAVTFHKRRQIRRIAEGYLYKRGIENTECRFDVIAIRWEGGEASVQHILNAF